MTLKKTEAAAPDVTGLVGDIGGTNARFALAHVGAGGIRVHSVRVLQAAEYPTGVEALAAYLADLPAKDRPDLAVIAAAGPIVARSSSPTTANGASPRPAWSRPPASSVRG